MTPTIADGKIFVATHTLPGFFAAFDVKTGAAIWSITNSGCFRAEPVIVNGTIIEGVSCGDPPLCYDGGLIAFNDQTGQSVWSWYTTNIATNGGAVWSPISFDGKGLYFGTGNFCTIPSAFANAVVSITSSAAARWNFAPTNALEDNDFGGSALVDNGQVFIVGKNDFFYDLDATTGRQLWVKQTGKYDGFGGTGSPTTDGTVLLVPTGFTVYPTTTTPPSGGGITAFDGQGNVLWSLVTQTNLPGYVPIANAVAYATMDSSVVALDERDGAKLWSYASRSTFYASPVVVPSGVYAADRVGDVFAFGLPGASLSAFSRR